MIPEIPSKHRSGREYKVVIMYVPTSTPVVQHNWMGYREPNTRRIKQVCCGPSQANFCPVGARTTAPCTHGAAMLFAGCCLAYNPQSFATTHSTVNIMDPGSGLPTHYPRDLLAGTISWIPLPHPTLTSKTFMNLQLRSPLPLFNQLKVIMNSLYLKFYPFSIQWIFFLINKSLNITQWTIPINNEFSPFTMNFDRCQFTAFSVDF